ncbi:MAG: hypothetical protein ACI4M6_05140 [Christensenellaceae bacterium]
MAEKKSMFSALVEKGRSSERRFTTLNASRWAFGFQVFRANVSKIIILNMLLVLFALPIILLYLLRFSQLSYAISVAPFSANMGIGYMPYTSLVGIEAQIEYTVNANFFKFFPLAMAFFGVGLAGVLEVNKKLLWLEEVAVFKDFLKGLSKNWLIILLSFIVGVIVSAGFMVISYANLSSAFVGNRGFATFTKVVCAVAVVLFVIMFLNMSVMHTTYKVSPFGLVKNCFLISAILIPLHLFFMAFSAIPVALMFFDGMFKALGLILIAVFGLEFIFFVWTDYSHWIYEKFLPSPVDNRNKNKTREEIQAERESRRAVRRDRFIDNDILPVKPISEGLNVASIPMVFSYADILKLNDDRKKMQSDSDNFKAVVEKMQSEAEVSTPDGTDKENNTNDKKAKKVKK